MTLWLGAEKTASTDVVQVQVTADYSNTYLARENIGGTAFSQASLSQVSLLFYLNATYSNVEFRGFAINWTGTIELSHVTLTNA